MITAKRSYPIAFLENGTTEAKITRGLLMLGLMLSVVYSANVTGAGTAVRAISLPIKRVTVIGDNGRVLHSIKAADAVNKARIYEQTALANLLSPIPSAAIANTAGNEANVPILFAQPFAANGTLTALPSFAYDDLTLRVEWGSVAELMTGAPTGVVSAVAGAATFTQLEAAGAVIANPRALARTLGVSVDRYKEQAVAAVALSELTVSIPVTADLRAILITTEDATGEQVNTILDKVTLLENNTTRVYSSVPQKTLRSDNAKVFGVAMPPGVSVIEFAEDRDITNIYSATRKDNVDLVFSTLAVAGTIRMHFITILRSPAARRSRGLPATGMSR